MNGLFKIKKFDACGFTNDDFVKAINNGGINEFLSKLRVKQELECQNRIFDNVAGDLLDRLFSLPACDTPFKDHQTNSALLGFIALLYTDSDTNSYTEEVSQVLNTVMEGMTDCVYSPFEYYDPNHACKYFYQLQDQDYGVGISISTSFSSGLIRDEIIFKSVFLFLPYGLVADNIKSVGVYWRADFVSLSAWTSRIARVRLKDSNGNNVTLTKNNKEALMFEYVFKIVSV